MAHLDALLIWYVEGLGTVNGVRLFSNRDMENVLFADINGDTQVVGIRNIPSIGPIQIQALTTRSSDAGYTINFGRTAQTLDLINVSNEPYISNGDAVRIAQSLTKSTTSFDVTDDAPISSNDIIWIGGESMKVLSKTGGDNITVTRAFNRTRAQYHPLTQPAKVIFDGIPSIEGRSCTLLRGPIDATAESELDVLFKGQVLSIRDTGQGDISIDVGSQFEAMSKQEWNVPQRGITFDYGHPSMVGTDPMIRDASGDVHLGQVLIDATYNNYDTWEYVRVWFDKDWVITNTTDGGSSTINGRLIDVRIISGETPVAMGKEDQILPLDRWDDVLKKGETKEVTNIDYAFVLTSSTDRTVGAFVEAVLTGTARSGGLDLPPSMSLNLTSSEIRSTAYDRIDDAFGWTDISNAQSSTPALVTPALKGSIFKMLETQILGPLGLAFTFQDGLVDVIDWRETKQIVATINDSDLAIAGYNRGRDNGRILRTATLKTPGRIETIHSEVANAFELGGLDLSFDIGFLGPFIDSFFDRWAHQLLIANERRVFVISLTLRDTPRNDNGDPLRVGDSVKLVLDTIPAKDGSLGVTKTVALITSIGENGEDRTRTVTMIIRDTTDGLALWAPCANCTGNVSGSTTIDISANEFTDSARTIGASNDATAFSDYADASTGVLLQLRDEFGTIRASNTPVLNSTGTDQLVISAAFDSGGALTINANDIITVADYDANPSAVQTGDLGFLADDSGNLGAANDTGRKWA